MGTRSDPVRLARNVHAWPAAEANAIIAAARGERMLSKPRRPYRKPTSPCSPGKAAPPSRCGAMEKRKPSTVSPWTVTYAPNGSAPAAGGESASKRPSAGGNIRGCRGADLVAQDFDLYGWRCACCGSGDWRWLSTPREAVRPRCRDVRHVPLASGQWPARGIADLVPVLRRLQGHGRTVHARADRRKEALLCL